MYTMKETCKELSMNYETLKFYCNQGLVPNVKRDSNNRRIFDDRDVAWLKSLSCLKKCGMSIQEMKEYLTLCLEGEASIPKRKMILEKKRNDLLLQLESLQSSICYIDKKQEFYDDVLCRRTKYHSNLIS